MTRKHYIQIAEIIAQMSNSDMRYKCAMLFAQQLKKDNPRFNPAKFISAASGFTPHATWESTSND